MEIRILTWNVFHGRDFPPDPSLRTRRSKLLRVTERNATHAQVNRDLSERFIRLLSTAHWDVALLQEFPPRWAARTAAACGADSHLTLTSRNSFALLRRLGAFLNPDLIGSNEGGSNIVLVRPTALGPITERRELVVQPGPIPERRVMAWVATEAGPCFACLHASAGRANRPHAEDEIRLAAETCTEWAAGRPFILGGDLNVRPRESGIYAELAERFGLTAPTSPGSLDHLLAGGMDSVLAPSEWPPEQREITWKGARVRLSDHAPVEAAFMI